MSNLSEQINIANKLPIIESANFLDSNSRRSDILLLIESIIVTAGVIWAIKVFAIRLSLGTAWFVSPAILIAAALIPAIIKRSQFPKIGFNIKQAGDSLAIFIWTCIVVFSFLLVALLFLKFYGFEFPLRPLLPQNQSWICWVIYQFLYVAVAEEVFFRGYLQSNILKLAGSMAGGQYWFSEWISIVISAACFAAAHILVQGQFISVLTFLPGVILGWLFVKTGTLFAPILFHGLANCSYLLIVFALAG